MVKILVVEDDVQLSKLFATVLVSEGYEVEVALDGEKAINLLEAHVFDLVISDVMMPRVDGYELVHYLRSIDQNMPILMISALGGLESIGTGFRSGIDDYMVKPVDVSEMLWRIDALLRRSQIQKNRILTMGGTFLDQDAYTLAFKDHLYELPKKEFMLLFKLLSSFGKIFTRHQIFEDIWGMDSDSEFHTLDVHISRLRLRLQDNDDFKIVTVRGLGYKAVNHEEIN